MPWQSIFRTIGRAEASPLDGLVKTIRTALGIAPRSGIDQTAFTAAVIALSAKLSKSDGVTLRIEEATFERLFRFDAAEAENVRWLFKLAAQDTAGFESYADKVAGAIAGQPELQRDVFEALMHIASADGVLHPGEDRFLTQVSEIFGYTPAEYRAIRARFVRNASDPYEVLGVSRGLANEALKAHYLDLVRANHPDALAGKGHSRQMQNLAERKLANINAAWDEITRERSL